MTMRTIRWHTGATLALAAAVLGIGAASAAPTAQPAQAQQNVGASVSILALAQFPAAPP